MNKPYYQDEAVTIYYGDCREILPLIPDKSIDLGLTDIPYGLTHNEWDIGIDTLALFGMWWRVLVEAGNFVMTCQQPVTSKLVLQEIHNFRYDLIWDKVRTTGFLNANRQPLRSHEHILIFYRKLGTYNPQFTKGEHAHSRGKMNIGTSPNYGKYRNIDTANIRGSVHYPKSILCFPKPHPAIHPTEKPIDLFQWLVNTYSNPNDVVLDSFLGSGTTAVACKKLNRKCIGIEIKEKYCEIAANRCRQMVMELPE